MTKYEIMTHLINKKNGYLFTSDVENEGISRTYMARYVRENNLEKVAEGIYVTVETWPDQLYIIQTKNPKVIYSSETALYLNMLLEREYSEIQVSVPNDYNGWRLREKKIKVHKEKDEIYGLGMCEIETNFGNKVRAYNRERSICDLIKRRSQFEVQDYQTAIRTYMRGRDKDLSLLLIYAEKLKIRDEVMKYVEVMV